MFLDFIIFFIIFFHFEAHTIQSITFTKKLVHTVLVTLYFTLIYCGLRKGRNDYPED